MSIVFSIPAAADGTERTCFYQYDRSQRVYIEGATLSDDGLTVTIPEYVIFSEKDLGYSRQSPALVDDDGNVYAVIPNDILESGNRLQVYAYDVDEETGRQEVIAYNSFLIRQRDPIAEEEIEDEEWDAMNILYAAVQQSAANASASATAAAESAASAAESAEAATEAKEYIESMEKAINEAVESVNNKADKDLDAVEGNVTKYGSDGNTIDGGIALSDLALKVDAGHTLSVSMSSDYVVTISLLNEAGTAISTGSFDLPNESAITNGSYNANTKSLIFTLQSGDTITVPISGVIDGLVTSDTFSAHTSNTDLHVNAAKQSAWSAKYDKPSDGIPKTDLASGVQASLNKADTALQEHQDLSLYSLIAATGYRLDLEYNSSTYLVTPKLYNANSVLIATGAAITLPVADLLTDVSYDTTNKKLVMTYRNGLTSEQPLATIIEGLATSAEVEAHTSRTDNPHSVTKSQLGLGNVDNTSDLSKPVSNAVQDALDLKVNTSDIVDNLTTQDSTKPLSAKQGNALNSAISDIGERISGFDIGDEATEDGIEDLNVDVEDLVSRMTNETETSGESTLNDVESTPSASSTGTKGQIYIATDYLYICVATNTWKKVALSDI